MIHVDKIKKLLRLARCKAASPAEAAQALNRALQLIEHHRIDIAALDLDEDTERIVCEHIHVGDRLSLIKRLVNGILLNYFHVRTCIDRPRLTVIGYENDVSIARYVFDFLVGACTRALRDYAQSERKARRKITLVKKTNEQLTDSRRG